MISSCPQHIRKHIFAWRRYIDDILIIFTGTYEQFDELFKHINSVHETIKFDNPNHKKEDNSCEFLDIEIKISSSEEYRDTTKEITKDYNSLEFQNLHQTKN